MSNEGCLPLRENATCVLHYSTWRIWGEPLPPPAQVRSDQPWRGKMMASNFSICSEDCMLRYEMVMFAQSIGIGNQ
jgi:hypothetical protein